MAASKIGPERSGSRAMLPPMRSAAMQVASMPREMSRPITTDLAGRRRRSAALEKPHPQPRSSTRRGAVLCGPASSRSRQRARRRGSVKVRGRVIEEPRRVAAVCAFGAAAAALHATDGEFKFTNSAPTCDEVRRPCDAVLQVAALGDATLHHAALRSCRAFN
eukprot:scaffold77344_cov65-Phaeocystis_antarctica.AAC.5